MKRRRREKNKIPLRNIILISSSFLITMVCLLSGSYVKEVYDITIDKVSPQKFVATREIENTVATERKIQDAQNSVAPLYTHDPNVLQSVLGNLDTFFKELEERKMVADQSDKLEDAVSDDAAPLVEPEVHEAEESARTSTPIIISDAQFEYYRTLTRNERRELEESVGIVVAEILEQGIRDATDTKSLLYARDEFNKKQWDDELRNMAYTVTAAILEPNLIVDEEATKEAKERKAQEIAPIIILRNQKIIDEGEIITEEVYAILDELNLIEHQSTENLIPHIGAVLIIMLLYAAMIMYMRLFYAQLGVSRKESIVLFVLYIMAILIIRVMDEIPFYIIPIPIITMLIAVLLEQKLSIVFNIFLVLIGTLIYSSGVDFMLFFFIVGTFSALMINATFQRNKIIFVGFAMGLTSCISAVAVLLFFEKAITNSLFISPLMALANGVLSLVITLGSLPIWEAVFDIVTPIKLMDLTNPNSVLLRKLTLEAPGTYHHSLVVANLAETAAYDIGANALVARVGAYYHDIGKLKYPFYFAENQSGENPHDSLDPYDSAKIIMQHVTYGQELAEAYGLPKSIKDIITQHHGTTFVKYFYIKAIKMYSEDMVKEADFRYPGVIPQTKECAIIMMADTVEAAVRSMISSSKEMSEIDGFVKKLIKGKLEDDQLDASALTMRELDVIKNSFMKVFKGMHHQRIAYPDKDKLPAGADKASKVELRPVTITEGKLGKDER